MTWTLGILADTHNRLPADLPKVFSGVELILHAGDVMNPETLAKIAAVAPVRVVRGNNDAALPGVVPDHDFLEFHGIRIGLTHGHLFTWGERGKLQMVEHFRPQRPRLIVCGHSHVYADETVDGVRILNPGTAGMHWFGGQPTAILLTANGRVFDIEKVEL